MASQATLFRSLQGLLRPVPHYPVVMIAAPAIELIGHQLVTGVLPEEALFFLSGLTIYAIVFGVINARFFKWEVG